MKFMHRKRPNRIQHVGASVPPDPSAPAFISPPSISSPGSSLQEGTTLTVQPGLVSGYPPSTRSYQWKADASNVGTDSPANTSFDTTGRATQIITVQETATNSEGSANSTSAGFGPIAAEVVTYHVILIAGQSNAAGAGAPLDAEIDIGTSRIKQWGASSIIDANEPLYGGNADQIGFGLAFARAYVERLPSGHKVLLVQSAVNGTGFSDSHWNSGNDHFNTAVSRANAAMTAAGEGVVFDGILWHQGETDAINNMAKAEYAYRLDQAIAAFRAQITAASSSWFILGRMVPEFIDNGAFQAGVDAAHIDTPQRTLKSAVWTGPSGQTADDLHYNAAGQRLNGAAANDAYPDTLTDQRTLPGAPTSFATGATTTTSVVLTWTAPTTGSIATDYVVQYRTTAGPGSWQTFAHAHSITTAIAVTGLTPDTGYDFRVAGANIYGTGTYTSTVSESTDEVIEDPPPVTAITWNPADKGTDVTLSNGNLTAAPSSNWSNVRGTEPNGEGLLYWEFTINTMGSSIDIMGIATGAFSLNGAYGGSNADSFGMWEGNNMVCIADYGAGVFLVAGHTYAFIFETTTKTITAKDITANITSSSYVLSTLNPAPWYPLCSGTPGFEVTANFDGPFTGTPPVGAVRWNGDAI